MRCDNYDLLFFLNVFKSILSIIHIVVPILLIIFLALTFIKGIHNPDDTNVHKRIINMFIATLIVFFIPILLNIVMSSIGEETTFSSCWNNANKEVLASDNYYQIEKVDKKSIIPDPKEFEPGEKDSQSTTSSIVLDADAGEKIARFGAQLAGYATGNISKGGPHWPGWYPNRGSIYLLSGNGGYGSTYPNIGVGYHNYKDLPNELTNLHNFWFVSDMTSRYPATKKHIKTYWGENFAYAGMWPILFATIRGSYDPSFSHSSSYLESSVKNGTYTRIITTFGNLDKVAQPGDIIGGANMGHDWIWIGNDIVRDYWPNAPKTAKMLTASGQEGLWPNIVNSNYGVWKGNVKATIYRPTGKVSISASNPLVINLTKFGLSNNSGFDSTESTIRQEYCDKNWPHLSHK